MRRAASEPTPCPGPAARASGRALRLAAGVVFVAALQPAAAAEAAAAESPAAREQARLCERLELEAGAQACRAALSLGIGPARRGPLRQLLAKHLVRLAQWDELADLYREDVRLDPRSAPAWERLGAALQFGLDQRAEAVAAFEEAVRLAPTSASARLGLGLALAAAGRAKEAAAEIEQSQRLDPGVLEQRPGALAVLEAARAGRSWP